MSFTHALSTNRYGEADLIVSTSAANGTHTTLTSAMAAATSGQTIFLRDSVTENVTITPGVNISSWSGGDLNTPTITGTLTMTGAGTSVVSGIRLQTNSAGIITVSGSAASILQFSDCYLNCTNNTGITLSSSNASSKILLKNCRGDLGTTGIKLFDHTGAGSLTMRYCTFTNTGGSTTDSTCSSGTLDVIYCVFASAITTSSTASFNSEHNVFSPAGAGINDTALTAGGSGGHGSSWDYYSSGTSSGISVGAGCNLVLDHATVSSSNTNAVTGAGTISYSVVNFPGSSSVMNTTTQTAHYTNLGKHLASGQSAFLAVAATQSNVTGDATAYTVTFTTEIFDQDSNFDGTSTFTAPVTGRYQINIDISVDGLTASHTTGNYAIVASNRTVTGVGLNIGASRSASNVFRGSSSVLMDMDAADTATVLVTISGGTKVVGIVATATAFSAFLAC